MAPSSSGWKVLQVPHWSISLAPSLHSPQPECSFQALLVLAPPGHASLPLTPALSIATTLTSQPPRHCMLPPTTGPSPRLFPRPVHSSSPPYHEYDDIYILYFLVKVKIIKNKIKIIKVYKSVYASFFTPKCWD